MDQRELAEKIVENSIVLLKNNDQLLPLPAQKEVAFLGRAQIETFYSGNGSGGAHTKGCRYLRRIYLIGQKSMKP